MIGSASEYAAHLGVGSPYVTKLKKQGRLVFVEVNGRQRVDFEASDRLVRGTADIGRSRNGDNARPAAARVKRDPPLSLGGANASQKGDRGGSLPDGGDDVPQAPQSTVDKLIEIERRSRAESSTLAAATARLQYNRLTGSLVDRAAAERTVFDAFRALRDHAFMAPQRAAARCVGISEMREIERIFSEELRKAYTGWEEKLSGRFAGGARAA